MICRKWNCVVFQTNILSFYERIFLTCTLIKKTEEHTIQMSSPKETDYQVAGDKKVIKKSIVPIMRMVIKNSKGEKELKGTLRFSHMIPVPETEVERYDVDKENDQKYKDLVQNEIIYIRKNQEKIRKNASIIYKQKTERTENVGYLDSVLDYKKKEEKCKEFVRVI